MAEKCDYSPGEGPRPPARLRRSQPAALSVGGRVRAVRPAGKAGSRGRRGASTHRPAVLLLVIYRPPKMNTR